MFIIDKNNNSISEITPAKFHDLGFKEKENLQEWIAKTPNCLGEELLIIQKEFDGFDDTKERLDLLALDKTGSLVIIENKLDDSGKDVVWQILRYVSYCATLTKEQIVEIYQQYLDRTAPGEKAKENLAEFFNETFEEISLNEQDQRMIMVSGAFRKEVTSTVMWMLNHGISVQCFKATPYKYADQLYLDMDQIIPMPEANDYIISMASKAKEQQETKATKSQIEKIRFDYWTQLLERFIKVGKSFQNINPSKDHWLSCGSGVSGCVFSFVSTETYAGVELNIATKETSKNKEIFDELVSEKASIEKDMGDVLIWDRQDSSKRSLISYKLDNVNIKNPDDWDKMMEFQCDAMVRFDRALRTKLGKAAKK